MMVKLTVFFVLFCILATGPFPDEMDWETYTLKALANDQTTAFDLLKKEFNALQYDRDMLVSDFLQTNAQLSSQISSLLLDYRILKQNYLTDGSIEYVYHLTLRNKILARLLPKTSSVKLVVPMLCPCCGQEWPGGKAVPQGLELVPKQIESTMYTGIVIDCRGFNLKPCFFPKIYNEMTEEVYSVSFANQNSIIDRGLVLYTTRDLLNNPRIGQHPLLIQAIDIIGEARTDIKISGPDARRIHGSKNNIELLKECRLAIIFGP